MTENTMKWLSKIILSQLRPKPKMTRSEQSIGVWKIEKGFAVKVY